MAHLPAPPLIDSHVHTDDDRLQVDRPDVLKAARKANIIAQIVPATCRSKWSRVKAVCADNDDLFPCYGLHPCFYNEHTEADTEELPLWLGREGAVAVGECGLDYAIAGADKAHQQHLFAAQLALAREFDLPIVIHARKAVEDVVRMIRASGHYRGVVHSYNGSLQQSHRLMDLGYMLSFGGAITYTRARRLQKLVRQLPLDMLLLETDAPDQSVATHSGKRNEPARLVDVWQSVSTLREEDATTIARITSANAVRLFKLPERITRQVAVGIETA